MNTTQNTVTEVGHFFVIRRDQDGKYLRFGVRNPSTKKWTWKWVNESTDAAEYTVGEANRIARNIDEATQLVLA